MSEVADNMKRVMEEAGGGPLEAGPKLDRKVAEAMSGIDDVDRFHVGGFLTVQKHLPGDTTKTVFRPSSDMNDAIWAWERAGMFPAHVIGKESYAETNPYYVAAHDQSSPGYNPIATHADLKVCICAAILALKGE